MDRPTRIGHSRTRDLATAALLGLLAWGLAVPGAMPYAGGWNDGCRLAAVESLVSRGTFAIDDSIFVRPPADLIARGLPPYPPDQPALLQHGTLDKLYIDGHFQSDKPALVSVAMAGAYLGLMELGFPPPADRPDVFCRTMTVLTSGLSAGVAVACLWLLGRRIGLAGRWRLAWVAAFALATMLPAYTRNVNNHVMQLAAVCVLLCRVADGSRVGRPAWASLAGVGFVGGLAYNLDLGSGPPLMAVLAALVAWRAWTSGRSQTERSPLTLTVLSLAAFGLGALPTVGAAHGFNYYLGGMWLKPMNMNPAYHHWAGSPFGPHNMTGFLRFGPVEQALYAADLMVGKKGFLLHTIPLWLAAAVGLSVLRRGSTVHRPPTTDHHPYTAELVALLAWCVLSWGMYAVLSNNAGGACCSVRWFVPFLAPGFWLLGRVVADRPDRRREFVLLAGWGAALAAMMWWKGPWAMRMTPGLWPITGLAFASWVAVRLRPPPAAAASDDSVLSVGPAPAGGRAA